MRSSGGVSSEVVSSLSCHRIRHGGFRSNGIGFGDFSVSWGGRVFKEVVPFLGNVPVVRQICLTMLAAVRLVR